jgi:hypothetical protein
MVDAEKIKDFSGADSEDRNWALEAVWAEFSMV